MFGLDDLKLTRYFQDVMLEGSLKTAREDVLSVLEVRFAYIPDYCIQILNKIKDLSILKGLLVSAATVQNIAEFQPIAQRSIESADRSIKGNSSIIHIL